MSVVIQDNQVRATILEHGAQPVSLYSKKDNIEYIWPADQKYWLWHAPLLFPIEGKLKNGTCYIDGQPYHMSQHGFARDQDFNIESKSENKVELSLTYSEQTLKMLPYKFKLVVIYEIVSGTLRTTYEVMNLDSKDIYFTVGSHPGFNVPLNEDEKYEDYYIELTSPYRLLPLNTDGFVDVKNPNINDKNKINITRDLFKDDALVLQFDSPNVSVSIKSRNNGHGVRVSSDNAKYWGIWSCYPKAGKFVCIEPWWGITDTVDTDQDFIHKFGNNCLGVGETYTANYKIKPF